jgi:hypothetical protein
MARKKKRKEKKGFQVTQMIVPTALVDDIRRLIDEEHERNSRELVPLKRDQIFSKSDAKAVQTIRDTIKQLRKPIAVVSKVQHRLEDVESEYLTRDDERWVERTAQQLYDLLEQLENLSR